MNYSEYEKLNFIGSINFISRVPNHFDLHWHKYIEILYYPRNSGQDGISSVRVNHTDYLLSPGDVILIWQGELHETLNNGSLLKGVQFPATYILTLPEFTPYIKQLRSIHHLNELNNPELMQLVSLKLEHAEQLQLEENHFSGIESLLSIYEGLIAICKHLLPDPDFANNEDVSKKTARKIKQACVFIAENCERDLTLEYVSNQVEFSSCYFSRAFKAITGQSFVEYLTTQRIKRAQELLSESDLSITEVSYQSGFKSISTFNRVFRQYKSCSPTEFRKYYIDE